MHGWHALAPRHRLHPTALVAPRFPPTGQHVLDEGERSLHDALCVLVQTVKDSRVVYGGGWTETQVGRGGRAFPQPSSLPRSASLHPRWMAVTATEASGGGCLFLGACDTIPPDPCMHSVHPHPCPDVPGGG